MDIETLTSILRGYDPSFDPDVVKIAVEQDASSALAGWAATYLSPDTLLTVEELLQYAALEKCGKAEQLGDTPDWEVAEGFNDDEIKAAIRELNCSTETIAKQTETLKHQRDALARLLKNESKHAEARSSLQVKQSQSLELNRKALASSAAGFAQDVELRVAGLELQGSGNIDATRQAVSSMLTADDKLLSGLQKLGWELETTDPEEKDNVNALRDICARLIKFTVETCRTRLDRVYLESLEAGLRSGTREELQRDEVGGMQDELESLYSEIISVAQMSVEQQYLDPALKSLAAKNGKSLLKSARAIDYVYDCLDFVLERSQRFASRVKDFHAYQAASSQLASIARNELAKQVETTPKTESRPSSTASPARRRKSSSHGSGNSPVRVRTAPRRRSSGTGVLSDEPPLEQLARMLALSLPLDEGSPSTSHNQLLTLLTTTVVDRKSKVADVASNVQDSFETATTTQLKDSSLAFQALRDSLFAESPFGPVRLVDPEIEGSIQFLEGELESTRKSLAKTDADVTLVRGRRGKQNEIIRRWGS